MSAKVAVSCVLFLWMPAGWALAAADNSRQTAGTVTAGDVAGWILGLMIVLAVFFLCVWGMRKLTGLNPNNAEKMRVVGGLSLGMREKILLVQAGRKQLILGVTPGRIQTLLVLEGDDCLSHEEKGKGPVKSGFALKLVEAIKARSDA